MLTRELLQIFRRMRRSPGFTALCLLTLGLGIGANTAIFTVVNSVLLKPLPFAEPDRLISLWHSAPGLNINWLNPSGSAFFTYREENRSFVDLGLYRDEGVSITGQAEPERVDCLRITAGLLPILQVRPALGRLFSEADDQPGAAETVVLTYSYWQKKFGGDPSVLGRRLLIDSKAKEIVGVLPASFQFMDTQPAVVLLFQLKRSEQRVGGFNYRGVARLRPGVSIEAASADVARMIPMTLAKFPLPPGLSKEMFESARVAPRFRPLKDDLIGDIESTLWVLMATIGIVLLIACANVANLLLVRVEGRQREMAVRAALGATRKDIALPLLFESTVLGLGGGLLGLVVAQAAVALLLYLAPSYLPRLEEIHLDASSLLFTFGVSVFAGILFGLLPMFKHLGAAHNKIGSGGRTMSEGRERHFGRNSLVALQVALAMLLLVGAGLMVRTLAALQGVDPGFRNPEQILAFRVSLPSSLAPDAPKLIAHFTELTRRLSAIPGTQVSGLCSSVTMDGNQSYDPLYAESKAYENGKLPPMRRYKFVGPKYFAAMGNPLRAGRDITWDDINGYRPYVLVSENLATELWGSPAAAIGKRVRENEKGKWREVIGVAGNERDDGADHPSPATVYFPLVVREMWGEDLNMQRNLGIVIRNPRAGTSAFQKEVRETVWSLNANLPLAGVCTVESLYRQSMARTAFTFTLLGIAAAMALLLGLIGIYGVISYSVAQRQREIGIRLALGAPLGSVSQIFVRHAVLLAAIGIGSGLAIAIPLSRFLTSLIYGVSPMDPLTYTAVAAVLLAAATLAAYIPSRRATQVDPARILGAD
jgi:putative ABC transport system permease protein